MAKLLLTLTNPPDGMNESQLFENVEHLDNWISELETVGFLSNVETTENSFSSDQCSGTIESKSDDFTN